MLHLVYKIKQGLWGGFYYTLTGHG